MNRPYEIIDVKPYKLKPLDPWVQMFLKHIPNSKHYLDVTPKYWTKFNIHKIEKEYKAKYVCESAIKVGQTWTNFPVLVFYCETKHPEGSNYFGIYQKQNHLGNTAPAMICDAISAALYPIYGVVVTKTNEIIFSTYDHDCRASYCSDVSIDGGRDYCRVLGDNKKWEKVNLIIREGEFDEVPTEMAILMTP